MSMITSQIENLRDLASFTELMGVKKIFKKALGEAADTIEELSAKLASANMERSTEYYNSAYISTNANHYGLDAQSDQLIEECAELIQAVNKWKRANDQVSRVKSMENLKEEIADVTIMIKQIKFLLCIEEQGICDIINYKLNRQLERMKE